MVQKDGKWQITEKDIRIGPDDMLINDDTNTVETYLGVWFDVDLRLKTETYGTDDYINLYSAYDPYTQNMELTYVIHYADGNVSDEISVDDFDADEKAAILTVMKASGLDDLLKELCECGICGTKIAWEGGDDIKGTIWSCERCGEYYCRQCFIDRYSADVFSANLGNDTMVCPDCYGNREMADTKLLYESYEVYKESWCAARGYELSAVDKETGIHGECYVCIDEFEMNEYQDEECMMEILSVEQFEQWRNLRETKNKIRERGTKR